MAWNPATMSEALIIAVKNHPALWDFTKATNKNRGLKDSLWRQVCQTLGWPVEDFVTVEGKWRNLRTTYQKQRTKQLTTEPSGSGAATPASTWPYFHIMDEFLSIPDPHHTKTVSNIPNPVVNSTDSNTVIFPVEITGDVVEIPFPGPGALTQDSTMPTEGASTSRNEDISVPQGVQQQTAEESTATKRRRYTKKSASLEEQVTDAINALSVPVQRDDFDIFGEFVASALRPLPPKVASEAQMLIMQTIFKCKFPQEEE
ncbi:uncharacterized protein [Amphiura filiformis]|uniref:uncharacterized protein n=1 Tax=Amphiura filiformis TaxID=82378 RepID=UPI003B21F57B